MTKPAPTTKAQPKQLPLYTTYLAPFLVVIRDNVKKLFQPHDSIIEVFEIESIVPGYNSPVDR